MTSTRSADEGTLGSAGPPGRPHRSVAALVAAGVLVVVVVALVLMFGIARPPALPSLADQPEPAPSAAVAWMAWERDSMCLYVARPDGDVQQVTCDDLSEILAWDEDGVAMWDWAGPPAIRWLDPVTGEEVHRERLDGEPGELGWPDWAMTSSRVRDGVLTVTHLETGDVLWAVEAPDAYRVHDGTVSPDGAWVAMFDGADRLLVVPSDGSEQPRVWTDDGTSWETPVWEGTPLRLDEGDL